MSNNFQKPYKHYPQVLNNHTGKYYSIRFADDIVLIVNSPEELQQLINELYASNEVGFKINRANTL